MRNAERGRFGQDAGKVRLVKNKGNVIVKRVYDFFIFSSIFWSNFGDDLAIIKS